MCNMPEPYAVMGSMDTRVSRSDTHWCVNWGAPVQLSAALTGEGRSFPQSEVTMWKWQVIPQALKT